MWLSFNFKCWYYQLDVTFLSCTTVFLFHFTLDNKLLNSLYELIFELFTSRSNIGFGKWSNDSNQYWFVIPGCILICNVWLSTEGIIKIVKYQAVPTYMAQYWGFVRSVIIDLYVLVWLIFETSICMLSFSKSFNSESLHVHSKDSFFNSLELCLVLNFTSIQFWMKCLHVVTTIASHCGGRWCCFHELW